MSTHDVLVPGDYCLRLTFRRDLSHKYDLHLNHVTPEQRGKELSPQREWCVSGHYDFLRIERVKKFENILEYENRDRAAHLSSERSETRSVVLYPFENDGFEPDKKFLSSLIRPDSNSDRVPPLIVFVQLSLSPAAYEIDDSYTSALVSISEMAKKLKDWFGSYDDAPQSTFWGSLGGCDVSVLSHVRSPSQLRIINEIIDKTCRLSLGRLIGNNNKDGHACSHVSSLLAFRLGAKDVFSSDKFVKEETDAGIRYEFRLHTDYGHERDVRDELEQILKEDAARDGGTLTNSAGDTRGNDLTRITWDSHSLCGAFRHLATFVDVWETQWFEDEWRRNNLLDSITVLCCNNAFDGEGDDKKPMDVVESAWPGNHDLAKALKEAEENIGKFSERYLDPTKRLEFRNVLNGLKHSFFRQEHIAAVRDLLPFFLELGKACGAQQHWAKYLNQDANEKQDNIERLNTFESEFDQLIAHTYRAVRNRLEQRSIDSDPPSLQTLRHGVCKTVNSYSVVTHICWKMLSCFNEPTASAKKNGRVDTSRFASCVSVGSSNVVLCDELLSHFREFVESESGLISSNPDDQWNARLLALSVPGRVLLKPEYSLFFCMQECAQVSDWIDRKNGHDLRIAINGTVLGGVTKLFASVLREKCKAILRSKTDQSEEPQDQSEERKDPFLNRLNSFAFCFLVYCYTLYKKTKRRDADSDGNIRISADEVAIGIGEFNKDSTNIAFRDLRAAMAFGCRTGAFEDYAQNVALSLPEAFGSSGSGNEKPRGYDDAMCDPLPDWLTARHVREALQSERLVNEIANYDTTLEEFQADVGMYCAISKILFPSDKSASWQEKCDTVCRVYEEVFLCSANKYGDEIKRSRLKNFILHRLAIQIAAIVPDEEETVGAVRCKTWEWKSALETKISEINRRNRKNASDETLIELRNSDGNIVKGIEDSDLRFVMIEEFASVLKQFKPYDESGKYEIDFLNLERIYPTINEVFLQAWDNPSTAKRINLLSHLWAISACFGKNIF